MGACGLQTAIGTQRAVSLDAAGLRLNRNLEGYVGKMAARALIRHEGASPSGHLDLTESVDDHRSMTEDRFADRLDPDTYRDDPLVGVFGYDYSDPTEVWIPERLWARLQAIGAAYQLHYLPLLDGGPEARMLNSTQAQGLVEELQFVLSVTTDSVLEPTIDEFLGLATKAARYGDRPALRVEGN